MRAKSMALLMLALGCGLVASIGITQVMAKRNTGAAGPVGETVPIFVAIKDVNLGDALTAEMIKQEPWPKDKVPPGAVLNFADLEGRRIRQKLFAGEPILENKLLAKGASSQGASAVIPVGYRVVSVKVDNVSGSGLILPGDRVDVLVYLVGNTNRDVAETSTRTVLQDVRVFAVNDVVDYESKDPKDKSINAKTISLLVTPAQAAKVTLACEMGKIRLVMRGPEDTARTEDVSAKPEELLGQSSFADRKKEEAAQKKPADKQPGIFDLLNQMKNKTATKQQPVPVETKTTDTWTMRILHPDSINDVVLETDTTPGSADAKEGHWRVSSSGTTSFGTGTSPSKNAPPKTGGKTTQPLLPPVIAPPVTPSASEPPAAVPTEPATTTPVIPAEPQTTPSATPDSLQSPA